MILRTERSKTEHTQRAVLAWLRMTRVFQKIDRRSEHLFRHHALNTAQFDVLAHVGATDGRSQQELADALLVTKGNISQLIGRLEQRGLIDRRHEGRTNCLSLTEAGRALFDSVVPEQEAQLAAVFSCLTDSEHEQLIRILRKLDRNVGEGQAVEEVTR